MLTCMLKAKIHRASVTEVEPDYEGSCGIDSRLLEQAGIRPFEQIEVYNVTNGDRLTTYAIAAPAHSGVISLNGAAAHRASLGDRVILCAYGYFTADELDRHDPVVVHVSDANGLACVARPNREMGSSIQAPVADTG